MNRAKRKASRHASSRPATSRPATSQSTLSETTLTQASLGRGWAGVLSWSLTSAVLLLAAFPPFSLYPLAWIAPLGWLIVCMRKTPVGRKGYFQLWLSGCLFWLIILHSIRLAFWPLYAGWIALSLYLAVFIPLWVGATRIMLHRWRIPLAIAAPVAWVGFEQIRSYVLTGYAANTLAHSQAWQPRIIQVADMLGHGGVSLIMTSFAALATQGVKRIYDRRQQSQTNNPGAIVVPIAVALTLLLSTIGYGIWRIDQAEKMFADRPALLRCMLLQENTPTIFEMSPDSDEYEDRTRRAWTKYANLCRAAAKQAGNIDLVVWPESTFTAFEPYISLEFSIDQPPDWFRDELQKNEGNVSTFETNLARHHQYFGLKLKIALLASRGLEITDTLPDSPGPQLLVGCDAANYGQEKFSRYAGALWIGSDGQIKDSYAKMHLVMFGEYIPIKLLLGWLERVFGFGSADAGKQPKSFLINDVRVSPNICFETMVPRLIRWQIKQLTDQGVAPDLLVNLTNDSWFKGTSMLDHHLASSILCCVENRRPLVVAANTGLTAHIDGSGRIIQCSQRQTVEALVVEPRGDNRWSLVQSMGYPLAWLCAAITLGSLAYGWFNRKAPEKLRSEGNSR